MNDWHRISFIPSARDRSAWKLGKGIRKKKNEELDGKKFLLRRRINKREKEDKKFSSGSYGDFWQHWLIFSRLYYLKIRYLNIALKTTFFTAPPRTSQLQHAFLSIPNPLAYCIHLSSFYHLCNEGPSLAKATDPFPWFSLMGNYSGSNTTLCWLDCMLPGSKCFDLLYSNIFWAHRLN